MPSSIFDAFVPPDSWPVLDTQAVPLSSDEDLQAHWREPRQRRAAPRAAAQAAVRSAMKRLPPAQPSALGQGWLASLPGAIRPVRTASRHPHVVDQLALVWDRPIERAALLHDLLVADRHDRRGFSLDVLEELVRLQACAVG